MAQIQSTKLTNDCVLATLQWAKHDISKWVVVCTPTIGQWFTDSGLVSNSPTDIDRSMKTGNSSRAIVCQ